MFSRAKKGWIVFPAVGALLALYFGAPALLRNVDPLGIKARITLEDRGPTVIQRIQSLSRLETISYTEQKILEGRKEWKYVPQWIAGDKLLFVAHGEVIAGIDLSQLKPEQIRLREDQAVVDLPDPQVFHVRLDNRASKVHHRSTGWLNRADSQLETQVRQKADDALLAGAMKDGILDKARLNAENEIRRLLTSMGAQSVTFI